MNDSMPMGGDGGAIAAPATTFAPIAPSFESTTFAAPTYTGEASVSTVSFAPIAGYDSAPAATAAVVRDTPQVVAPESPKVTAEVPSAFKSTEAAKYQVSEKLQPVAPERAKIAEGESPKINVSPKDDTKPADITIGKDGSINIAQGLTDGDKPLSQYNVQVEAGADPKVTEKVLDDLGSMIHEKCPACSPRIESSKDESGSDIVSGDYRDKFRERYRPADNDENADLPDDPQLPDGGGGGGGCDGGGGGGGGGDDLKPDELNPETDDNPGPDGGGDSAYRERGLQSLKDMSNAMGDMNANQYGNWMMSSMLPAELLEELGDPPWTGEKLKKLQDYLKNHGKDIKKNMGDKAAALEKQGDTEGAKAITDFSNNLEKNLADPAKLEQFTNSFANFAELSHRGEASTSDVHAMFGNDANLERAIRNSQIVETAKKYDTSKDGQPDLEKVKKDRGDQLIAELQIAPKKAVTPIADAEKKKDPVISFLDLVNKK